MSVQTSAQMCSGGEQDAAWKELPNAVEIGQEPRGLSISGN